jgi:YbbR domain-containing protein
VITGQPAFGYRVVEVQVIPNEVTVRGKGDAVSRYSTIATEPVSIDQIQATQSIRARLKPPAGLRLDKEATVTVRIVIEAMPKASIPPVTSP